MPVLHFGGGTIGAGAFSTSEEVSNLLDKLQNGNVHHIDTAGVYPMSAPGGSEKVLGAADAAGRGFVIDTKILVTGPGPGQGSLAKEAVAQSLAMSLKRLRVGKVRENIIRAPTLCANHAHRIS